MGIVAILSAVIFLMEDGRSGKELWIEDNIVREIRSFSFCFAGIRLRFC